MTVSAITGLKVNPEMMNVSVMKFCLFIKNPFNHLTIERLMIGYLFPFIHELKKSLGGIILCDIIFNDEITCIKITVNSQKINRG